MFFKCKGCAEKDKHIDSLKNEISFLRGQLTSPASLLPATVEANKILDGAGDSVIDLPEYNDFQLTEQEKIKLEADRILTGAY